MDLRTETILTVRDALNRGETPGPEMVATGAVFVWRSWAELVNELNDAWVPLLVGSDLPVPGTSVHEEMAIWQEAGIAPADVLRGAV